MCQREHKPSVFAAPARTLVAIPAETLLYKRPASGMVHACAIAFVYLRMGLAALGFPSAVWHHCWGGPNIVTV